MQSTSLKSKMESVIRDLPESASIEDAMEKLFFLYKIEKGIEQADAGLTVSHEEAKQRLGKWLD
tara:strand:+ start:144 stop:335 length:192 start_codon:yes stop_codon:yes gene_type:complete